MTIYTDFTKRDYTSTLERLYTILSEEVPDLTDRNHSDAGISLIRLLARSTDMLSFYIDEAFIESYVDTARFKQSLIDLAAVVECRPKLASPAVTTITYTRKSDFIPDITIPANTVITRSDGTPYLNLDTVFIPSATETGTFDVYQLERVVLTVTKHDFDYYGFKRIRINLGQNVVSGLVTMYDTAGDWYWTEVDSFYRSLPTSTHFMLESHADSFDGVQDTVFLSIGDGIYGSLDLPNAIVITYYRTLGAIGNGGTGILTTPSDLLIPIDDEVSKTIDSLIDISNTTVCTGGAAVEDIEHFRARIPRLVQTQRRGLTELDYEALIDSIPGVLSSQAQSRSSDANWPYMYVILYILPEGGVPMTEYLKDVIHDKCKSWGHLGDWSNRYVLLDAVENVIDVTVRVGKKDGFRWSQVDSDVRAALTEFFLPSNILVGDNVSFSELNRKVSALQSVDWVEFITPTATIVAPVGNTYSLGTVSIQHAQ